MVELAKFLRDSLFLWKSQEMNQVMIEQGDLLYKYFETILQGVIFFEFIDFVADGSLTVDGGLL